MNVIVTTPFSWSPNGWDILEFKLGAQELPIGAAHTALAQGWAREDRLDAVVSAPTVEAPKRRGRPAKVAE